MIAGVAGALVAASAVTATTVNAQRRHEWAHGGDALKVQLEVSIATPQTFDSIAAHLGAPPGAATRNPHAKQSVVVRVRWSEQTHADHSLQLMVLDGRLTPPRPLAADAGWNSAGSTGSQWSSNYASLAQHYDWLAGMAATDTDSQARGPSPAVDAGTGPEGTATGWFWQWENDPIPFPDPAQAVIVALVDVDNAGEVRWARRISD